MNFEQAPIGNTKKETINLYPERAFVRIDEEIKKIKKIESGEIKKIELSDLERETVLSFENGLGEKLEEIETIKVNSSAFFVDYFLTPEGKEAISSLTGLEVSLETAEEVSRFFLENRQILDGVDGKKTFRVGG